MPILTTTLSIKDSTGASKTLKQGLSGVDLIPTSTLLDENGNLITTNNGLPVIQAENSFNAYSVSFKLAPVTTLTAGTVYAGVRNGGSKTIKIDTLDLLTLFTGTSAASTSDYELVRFTAGTAITGTGALTPAIVKRDLGNPNSSALEVKYLQAGGIGVTGTTIPTVAITPNGNIITHSNQLVTGNRQIIEYREKPLILRPQDGFIIRAFNTLIAGTNLTTLIHYYEI
jgi:hypothetical protein